ncbi:hypothetical protein BG006_006951 [Podila minutissima]|uniref:Uncharacterized protein n=1 Tax=Podila minutissima TaxID=64525 RepID=A0A9P5VKP9_9FUNG|nr:hypothetical protein BG006_006951 [Podila minutissima]
MRGRLPGQDVGAQDTPVADPTPFTRDLVENRLQPTPYNEQQTLAEHSLELESRIQRTLSDNAPKVDQFKLSDSERAAFLQTMQRIRPDVHELRKVLLLTGRPPDERERGLPAAPDWDDSFLQWLCDNWGQHVHPEPDYYYLRALSLYQFSQSDLIAIRGPQRQKEYIRMSLIQAREANLALMAALQKSDDSVGKYWRYHILASRIHQGLAHLLIKEIQGHEHTFGTKASELLYNEARESVVEALNSFHQGIQHYPSSPSRSHNQDYVKGQEWAAMANVARAYTLSASDFHTRLTWTQHSIALVTGAIREDKARKVPYVETIARAYKDFAFWIHSHPERPLMVFPDVTPMFKEMQFASLAGLIYARSAMDLAKQSDTCLPHHYCLTIECALMMSLTCISRKLLHEYSQEAVHWVNQLQISFPYYDIDPWYLQAVRDFQAKENAMKEIRQHRMKAK